MTHGFDPVSACSKEDHAMPRAVIAPRDAAYDPLEL